MPKMRFGLQGQVSFKDLNEYYYSLGFLANQRNAELRWENNEEQGAWGSEGRIYCYVPAETFPQCFRFTAGTGSVYARVNCNDYVGTLVTEHHFAYNGGAHNLAKILETVPEKYRDAFKEGYGAKIDINPEYKPVIAGNYAHSGTKSTSSSTNTAGMSTQQKPPEKPKPEPLPVEVGEVIVHKVWGAGKVYEVDGHYLRISFPSVGDKSFVNPDAFEKGFIKKQ